MGAGLPGTQKALGFIYPAQEKLVFHCKVQGGYTFSNILNHTTPNTLNYSKSEEKV